MVISYIDGFDHYSSKPTVQSIWDQNDLDDYAADQLAAGRIWRLASSPAFTGGPWEPGLVKEDAVKYVGLYRAIQKDSRHWEVFGMFEGVHDWEPVGWLVR